MAGCTASKPNLSNKNAEEDPKDPWPKLTEISGLQLPDEIAIVILMFEGSVLVAYQRDFIGTLYSEVYKTFFGSSYGIRRIQNTTPDNLLPYYCAFVTHVISLKSPRCRFSRHGRYQPVRRIRKSRKNMRIWLPITQRYDLTRLLNKYVALTTSPLAEYFKCERRRFKIRDIGRGMIYW